MNRVKLSPDGYLYERGRHFPADPDVPAWTLQVDNGTWIERVPLTDEQVADWPDLAPVVDVDHLVAEIVAAASHDVEPLLVCFDPPLRIAYEGRPGQWNVSVTIAPRGHTPRFVRAAAPKLLDALAELHAKVVGTDEPRDA